MAKCKSCGVAVFWVETKSGSRNPLIADPKTGLPAVHPDTGKAGRIQLEQIRQDLTGGETYVVRMLRKGQEADPDKPVWLTHFVDCPQAVAWRRATKIPKRRR